MKVVYLDQNKWIELAKVAHGRSQSPDLQNVLDTVRQARDAMEACFPLSFGHYVETPKSKNKRSRARLANFMLEISEYHTLADGEQILRHELDQALRSRFPDRVRADQLTGLELLGRGVSHAGGCPPLSMPITQRLLEASGVPGKDARQVLERRIEFAALTGLTPSGEEIYHDDWSELETNFLVGLKELQRPFLHAAVREGFLHVRAMQDIETPLNEAIARHDIPVHEIKSLGEWLWDLLEDLPSVMVDIHLHRQWAKNRYLPVRPSDSCDFAYVGTAAMYCDIVVTEKQLADLLQRDGFRCRAEVLTDLRDLPELLGF